MDEAGAQQPGAQEPINFGAVSGATALPSSSRPSAENPAPWQDYQTVFTNAKAGMDGVDKERIQRVVYEMSKDSAHFRNEQRKQAAVNAKVERLRERSARLTAGELAAALRSVDGRIATLEASRDLTRTWLHADMDCFYAAVHETERPELKQVPMAVGDVGMISTANYVARKYGVRSAMPGFIAKRLCPQLVFVQPDFPKYTIAAERVRAVFRQLDPDFESGGLDEAYLDVTDYCARTGSTGQQAAEELRRRVRDSCGGLTCSCGVASNKMLAKICSDINKPDGQYVLPPSRVAILSFLDTLPTRKIPCIGKVTEQLLRGVLGVTTCGKLLGPSRSRLPLLFSETAAGFFLEAALGLAATRHSPKTDNSLDPGRKGISCERTFRDTAAPQQQEALAKQLVESLAADMAAEELEGRNLTLKLKLSTFEVRTRAVTLPRHVRTAADMLPPVLRLLRAEMPVELRLMGIRAAGLRKVNSAVRSPLARLLGLRPLRRTVSAPPSGASEAAAATATAAAVTITTSSSPEPCHSDPSLRQPDWNLAPAVADAAAVGVEEWRQGTSSIAAAAAATGKDSTVAAACPRGPVTALDRTAVRQCCTTMYCVTSPQAGAPWAGVSGPADSWGSSMLAQGQVGWCLPPEEGKDGGLPYDPWVYDMGERGCGETWDEQDVVEQGEEAAILEVLDEEEDNLYNKRQELYDGAGEDDRPAHRDRLRLQQQQRQDQQQKHHHSNAEVERCVALGHTPWAGDGNAARPKQSDPAEDLRPPKRQRQGNDPAAADTAAALAAAAAAAAGTGTAAAANHSSEEAGCGRGVEGAAASTVSGGGRSHSGHGVGGGGGGAASSWTCRVCTFAHNRRQLLRCEVCDCLRGSTQPPQPPPAPIPPHAPRGTQGRQQHQRRQQQRHQHQFQQRKGGQEERAAAAANSEYGSCAGRRGEPSFSSAVPSGAGNSGLGPDVEQRPRLLRLWASGAAMGAPNALVATPPPPTSAATTTAATKHVPTQRQQQPQGTDAVGSSVSTGSASTWGQSTLPPRQQPGSGPGQQQWGRQRTEQAERRGPGASMGQHGEGTGGKGQRGEGPQRSCPQCGQRVCVERWLEHQDLHLAVGLSREGSA